MTATKENFGGCALIVDKSPSKFGHYQVGTTTFLNKVQALEYASNKDLCPSWYFNDLEFSRYDWTQEPCESLDQLYRKRAEQIRSKYQNVILFYSGGIDSYNILMTFVKNKIKIDAVVIYGTFDFDRNKDSKFNLELYNVAIPVAQRYQDLYDLHILDISDLYKTKYHPEWFYQGGVQLAPFEFILGHIYDLPYFDQWFNQGSTALVRGIDKPRVIFHDNKFWLAFLDCALMQTPSVISERGRWLVDSTEFFYWSPDAPWLLAKQAHTIKRFFQDRPELQCCLSPAGSQAYHDVVDLYVNPLIYDTGTLPGQKMNLYNLGKGGDAGPVFHHKDHWFHSSSMELSSQKMWSDGIIKIESIVHERYKNQGTVTKGLAGLWSKWYSLG